MIHKGMKHDRFKNLANIVEEINVTLVVRDCETTGNYWRTWEEPEKMDHVELWQIVEPE